MLCVQSVQMNETCEAHEDEEAAEMVAQLKLLADDFGDVRPAAGRVHVVAIRPVVAAAALVHIGLFGPILPRRPRGGGECERGGQAASRARHTFEAAAHYLRLHVHEYCARPKLSARAALVH